MSALRGLIRARAIHAESQVSYTGSGFRFADGSHFVHVRVAGHQVSVHANTRITLPHLGYVILHERTRSVKAGRASQTITMIHVVVTASGNVYGLSPGTNIVVARAGAALTAHVAGGFISGVAYGTHAQVGNVALSGRSALASIPCLGGSSSNRTATVTVPKAGSASAVVDTAFGKAVASGSSGTLSSTTHSLKLLKGLIRANVVHAQISGSFNGVTPSFTDRSTFTDPTVKGLHVSVHPNTVIKLGFATLYVHRQIRTSRALTVRMIELVIKGPNVYSLKTGTDIQVAVTHLAFHA
jgi:hypothetical protein